MELTNKEIFALAKKARERGELSKYLCGEDGYAILGNPDIPANIPTDFRRMIHHGVYALYKAAPDEKLVDEFVRAIVSLDDTPVHVWCAYQAVFLQILNENSKDFPAPFTLPDGLRDRVRANVLKNETALRNCREYLGEDYKNGLWGHISLVDKNLAEECGVCILR